MKTELTQIPVLFWAEIGEERIELVKEISVSIGEGHCPILARKIFGNPMARALANTTIKTGWEYCNPNASALAATPTENEDEN